MGGLIRGDDASSALNSSRRDPVPGWLTGVGRTPKTYSTSAGVRTSVMRTTWSASIARLRSCRAATAVRPVSAMSRSW